MFWGSVWEKIADFSVIFVELVGRVRRLNDSTPEPNVIGLVKIYPLFTRRVSKFGQIRFRSVQADRVCE